MRWDEVKKRDQKRKSEWGTLTHMHTYIVYVCVRKRESWRERVGEREREIGRDKKLES